MTFSQRSFERWWHLWHTTYLSKQLKDRVASRYTNIPSIFNIIHGAFYFSSRLTFGHISAGQCETAVVLTVPDFPACRPLTELQAAAKLLLYSANNSAGKNKNEFPLYSSCCSCRMYWQKFAPICPTGARGREGFLGSVPRMNALARLFTQSPGQSCLACRVCQ